MLDHGSSSWLASGYKKGMVIFLYGFQIHLGFQSSVFSASLLMFRWLSGFFFQLTYVVCVSQRHMQELRHVQYNELITSSQVLKIHFMHANIGGSQKFFFGVKYLVCEWNQISLDHKIQPLNGWLATAMLQDAEALILRHEHCSVDGQSHILIALSERMPIGL